MTAARKYVLKLWKLLVCGSHLWTKNITHTHTTPVWSFFSSICCCTWMTLTMKSSLWHWVRFNLDIKTLLFFCDITKMLQHLAKPDFFPPVVMCNRVYPGPKMICPKMCLLDIWRHIDTPISKFKQWEDVHMNSPSAIAVDCSIVESGVELNTNILRSRSSRTLTFCQHTEITIGVILKSNCACYKTLLVKLLKE